MAIGRCATGLTGCLGGWPSQEREDLISDLIADRDQLAAQHLTQGAEYDGELKRMRDQIADREAVLAKLEAARYRTEDEKRAVTDQYRQVQAELSEMRDRVKAGEGALKRMRGADRKISEMGAELGRMVHCTSLHSISPRVHW